MGIFQIGRSEEIASETLDCLSLFHYHQSVFWVWLWVGLGFLPPLMLSTHELNLFVLLSFQYFFLSESYSKPVPFFLIKILMRAFSLKYPLDQVDIKKLRYLIQRKKKKKGKLEQTKPIHSWTPCFVPCSMTLPVCFLNLAKKKFQNLKWWTRTGLWNLSKSCNLSTLPKMLFLFAADRSFFISLYTDNQIAFLSHYSQHTNLVLDTNSRQFSVQHRLGFIFGFGSSIALKPF